MPDFEIVEVPTDTVASLRRVVPVAEIKDFFDSAYRQVAEAVTAAGGEVSMPPFGWYHGMPTDTIDVTAGFPVRGDVHTPDGGIHLGERPGGKAAVGMHVGSYDSLGETYGALMGWLAAQSLTPRGDFWEEYLSPPEGDPATWRTRVVIPVA